MIQKIKLHSIINRVSENMPDGFRHSFDNQKFDIRKSEVAKWISDQLCSDEDFLQAVFNRANVSKSILFDPETKTWAGRNSIPPDSQAMKNITFSENKSLLFERSSSTAKS